MKLKHPFLLKIIDRIIIGVPGRLQRWRGRPYLAAAVRKIVSLPEGSMPTPEMLTALRRSWGNPGFSPSLDLLTETARLALAANGPILECGSGLTTLLLGLLTKRRGLEVWSLEHHPKWHARIRTVLRRHRLHHVKLHLAPLTDYGAYEWYAAPVAQMPQAFHLVICDGPPSATPGARYGLMPVMRDRLAGDCIILLDDSHRRREQKVLEAWTREHSLVIRALGTGNCLAVIGFANGEIKTSTRSQHWHESQRELTSAVAAQR